MQRLNPDGASDGCRELRHSLDSSCDNICALDFAISHPSDWRMQVFPARDLSFLSSLWERHPLQAVYQSAQQFSPRALPRPSPIMWAWATVLFLIVVLSFHLLYLFTFPLKLIPK